VNRNTVIALIAVIVVMPLVYIIINIVFPDEPQHAFRGYAITPVLESYGTVTVPLAEDDQKGAPLRAKLKPVFLEKVAGMKSPNPNDLELTVDSVLESVGGCAPQGKIPDKAGFVVAKACVTTDFASWQAEKKAAPLVDDAQQMIVFGASGNNLVRVYHKNLVATYTSPDMVQSDRKKEACIVGVVLDHLTGAKPDPDFNCSITP
jgi:hypothetical protein